MSCTVWNISLQKFDIISCFLWRKRWKMQKWSLTFAFPPPPPPWHSGSLSVTYTLLLWFDEFFPLSFYSHSRTHIKAIDEILFRKPVEVGSFLFFLSEVRFDLTFTVPILETPIYFLHIAMTMVMWGLATEDKSLSNSHCSRHWLV